MSQRWRSTVLASAAALAQGARAVIAPSGTLASVLPHATAAGNWGPFISDGGAGGKINGQNLWTISDGSLVPGNTENAPSNFPSCHTAYAYLNASNPSQLIMLGNYYDSSQQSIQGRPDFWHGTGGGLINYIAQYDVDCGGDPVHFAPAPHVAPIPIPGNSTGALNVWPVHINNFNNTGNNMQPYVYNTMFEMNVLDANTLNNVQKRNMPAVRTVPVLFNVTKGQPGYGSRALTSGNGSEASTYFYLWEGDSTGLKLARAPWALPGRRDVTQWDYWRGSSEGWVRNKPLKYDNAYGNVFNQTDRNFFFGVDVRYVDRFQTYVITYSGGAGYSTYMRYSLTGQIVGPYSAESILFNPQLDPECTQGYNGKNKYGLTDFNQMHWDYYGLNSNKVLVSWISCTTYQNVAVLNWSNGINGLANPA